VEGEEKEGGEEKEEGTWEGREERRKGDETK